MRNFDSIDSTFGSSVGRRTLPFLRASVACLFKRSRNLDVACDQFGHFDQFCIFCSESGPLPSIHVQNLGLVPSIFHFFWFIIPQGQFECKI